MGAGEIPRSRLRNYGSNRTGGSGTEAPHFHVLGCGFFRCEKDEDRPAVLRGAVVTTLSRKLDEEATRRALYYLLDHSAVPVDGHRELAVRYYGDFHSSRVRGSPG